MRLALIASGFADYSLELAAALAASHTVQVVADAGALACERAAAELPAGVEVRSFSQAGLFRRWGCIAPLAAGLAAWRPDAIVAHEHGHPHLTGLLALASRIAPLGLIVHDPAPHPGRDEVFARRHAGQIAAQRRLATHLFVHGGEVEAQALSRACGRPVTAIVHGPILRPPTPASAPPGRRRVLMMGRMEAYKGLDVLLDAARRLQDRRVDVSLELRGAGPELDRLSADFQRIPGCTVHPTHASRAELLQALAGCDLVVAPYLQASGSGVAAATLANGRGLVASDVGGLRAAVRDRFNGLLVPPGDPQALADALERGLDAAGTLGAGARALADGPLSWRSAAEAITQTLERVGRNRAVP